MKQEEKDLLLKDLCARLPYGVKCKIYDHNYIICDISFENQHDVFYKSGRRFHIGVIGVEENGRTFYMDVYEKLIKPYLFPLSSMTEEQKKYITDRWGVNEDFDFEIDPNWGNFSIELGEVVSFINWCYENHFDINSLIPRELAIDAADKNIY